jgi:hypothetical protein
MPDWLQMLLTAGGGGMFVYSAPLAVEWIKSVPKRREVELDGEAKIEHQRNDLTFELLKQAHDEVQAARKEVAELRPLQARLAHFEEALDHIHALLASTSEAEREAATRRAQAFLRRMRGDDAKGQLREEVQTHISAERIKLDASRKDRGEN